MDEPHAWTTLKYIERNPVRVGITTSARDYQWSSASYHVLGAVDLLLTPCPLNTGVYTGTSWKHLHSQPRSGYEGKPEFVFLGHAKPGANPLLQNQDHEWKECIYSYYNDFDLPRI